MAFTSTLTFTPTMCSAAPSMDTGFENMLRSVEVHKDVTSALRLAEITTRGLFVSMDSTEEGLEASANEAFGIDTFESFPHKREFGKLMQAWELAKVQNSRKAEVDASGRLEYFDAETLRQNSERTSTTAACYLSLASKLLEEMFSDGDLYPETLAQVVSLVEEHRQKQSKFEGNRQLGLSTGSLTIQSKHRYL